MSYSGYITQIKEVKKHPNADRLNIGNCFGNQVIVDLKTKSEDIGIYFPSDGQLSEKYCEVNNLVRKKDINGNEIGGYLDPNKRNIRAIKLRGEISDGLFMPLESLDSFIDISKLKVGDLIDTINGVEICTKYIPVVIKSSKPTHKQIHKGKKKLLKESFPMFHEHIDTKQLMYNLNYFKEGMICYITLKMHGTSGRTSHTNKVIKKEKTGLIKLFNKLFKLKTNKISTKWQYITGTRRVILEDMQGSGGYYEDTSLRPKYHKEFVGKLKKGETVFYEIVGFENSGKPIMGTVSNKKTRDKDFIKKYGESTTFSYGYEVGENDMYVYRMTMDNEDGDSIDYPWDLVKIRCEQMGVKHVLELDRFVYTTEEDLLARVNTYVDGVDPVDKTHIREGVVVRVEGQDSFKALKHKNFFFKFIEGIIKDDGFLDMEERASIIEKEGE